MVRAINVTFSPVELSLGASKESVSSVAREDGYFELSFIYHTLMQAGVLTGPLLPRQSEHAVDHSTYIVHGVCGTV